MDNSIPFSKIEDQKKSGTSGLNIGGEFKTGKPASILHQRVEKNYFPVKRDPSTLYRGVKEIATPPSVD